MGQLYSRTEMTDASDASGALPQEASGAGPGPDGIMSALPRRRVQRRSVLRASGASGAVASAQAIAELPEEHPRLRSVESVAPSVAASPRRASKRPALPPPREPAPGIGRLALDGVVVTAKLPWRAAAEVARQAAGSLAATLRR